MTPLAHGVGSAENLPLPLDLVLQAGAATVVLSFLISAFWWRTPRLRPSAPRSFGVTRWFRYPVLALTLYITGYAIVGPRTAENPAAHALFVWLWVGLVLVSVIAGPVWRTVNPLRTIFAVLGLPRHGLRPLPHGRPRTSWPAAAFLLAFVWFELVAPHHGDPVTVGLFLLAYAVTQLTLATLRGEEWFSRGDCFEAYSDLAGRLSPIRWRQPLSGLVAARAPVLVPVPHSPPPAPERPPMATAGLAGFIAVWWGSTVFDSASGFVDRAGQPLLWGTAGLALLCTLVFLAVRWTAGRLDVTMSLIPIAAGYTLAHYLSVLIVEAPRGFLLLVGASPDLWTVTPNPQVLAGTQIALILIGHVLGVIVAHDDALATSLSRDPARPPLAILADELPLVLFMIGCTWAGLFLLFLR